MRTTTSPTPRTKRPQRRPAPPYLVLVPRAAETKAPALPTPPAAPQPRTEARRPTPALVQYVLMAIRVALGLAFVVCGLQGFFDFLPRPQPAAADGAFAFGSALIVAGSMLPLLKGSEVLLSALLDAYEGLAARRRTASLSRTE